MQRSNQPGVDQSERNIQKVFKMLCFHSEGRKERKSEREQERGRKCTLKQWTKTLTNEKELLMHINDGH